MAKSILDKYKSIDQTKISKEAKTILLKIKVKTRNFKETTPDTNRVFNTFYSKLQESKPQAIKGYKAPTKATPKAATKASPKASSKGITAAELLKQAKKNRANQGISTSKSDIEKDALRPAKPKGYRITDGTNYPYVKGNKYWEGRDNRLDRKQPPKKYPKLEDGGMMAKGGKLEVGVYRVGKPTKIKPNFYEQKIVEIFDNGDISTASDYGRSLQDFKSQSYPIISIEQLNAQYKMAHGGKTQGYDDKEDEKLGMEYGKMSSKDLNSTHARRDDARFEERMAKGGEVNVDDIKSKMYGLFKGYLGNFISEEELINGLSRVLGKKRWFRYFRNDTGVNDVNSVKIHLSQRVNKDFEKEQMQIAIDEKGLRVYDFKGNEMMAKGGEVGQGFLIRDMREKLNRMFPDTFGFTVGNVSKEGNKTLNSAALIVDTNDPYRGLEDKDIQSKLFFPQYKRDHNINFRVMQGGENTYFYFELESEKGDEYIGQFGFKDSGDVPASYITSFIAFLMEQYGLPFEIEHQVMANGGKVGEPHRIEIGG